MKIATVLLNALWTSIGLCAALLSAPHRAALSKNPPAVIFYIKSFWWYWWLPGKSGVRAITWGHVVMMSTYADDLDLTHELIHVEQHMRWPLIFPLLYFFEMLQYGGTIENKYQKEAYTRSGSRY